VDQLRKIIVEAEQLNAKHCTNDVSSPTLDDMFNYNNDEKKLMREVETLSHDARMELMALMWIGQGAEDHFAEATEAGQ
jgi:hypothetical protein